jgi:hypothetical protein
LRETHPIVVAHHGGAAHKVCVPRTHLLLSLSAPLVRLELLLQRACASAAEPGGEVRQRKHGAHLFVSVFLCMGLTTMESRMIRGCARLENATFAGKGTDGVVKSPLVYM